MMSCLPVMWVNGSVYSNEMFDPKWRIFTNVFNTIPIASYIFGLIVYLNRTWTGIHITCGAISCLVMFIWFLVPESPRWLAQNGQEEKAMEGKNLVLILNFKGLYSLQIFYRLIRYFTHLRW